MVKIQLTYNNLTKYVQLQTHEAQVGRTSGSSDGKKHGNVP